MFCKNPPWGGGGTKPLSAHRLLYQHSNIIESGGVGGGGDVPNWTILRKYEATLTIYSIFLVIKKSIFLYQEINPISWYQNFMFWFKEIHFLISKNRFLISRNWIDFSIKNRIDFFYIIDFFFISRNGFLYQKSIFDITKYRMNSNSAPQRADLLFIRYFFYSWYKKHQSEFLI